MSDLPNCPACALSLVMMMAFNMSAQSVATSGQR